MKIHENIKNGKIRAKLVLFVSDQQGAHSVHYAKDQGIPMFVFDQRDYENKTVYERMIVSLLDQYQVDLVVLAGYMKKIGPTLLKAYEHKIINIHPSLLPLFKGKDAIHQAWESKVQMTGVTIHYVDEKIDHGKIIIQESLKVTHHTIEELTEAIHQIEHRIYSETIHKLLEEMI